MDSASITTHGSPPLKRARNNNNYLHTSLKDSGLILNFPPQKCQISTEPIYIVHNLKTALLNSEDYPRNIKVFLTDLEKECCDTEVFKHYVYPNIIQVSDTDVDEYIGDSVMKILLSISILQSRLTDIIFEKALDLAAEDKCGSCIHMVLKCFTMLDYIEDSVKVTNCLMNLLDMATEKLVRLEIITAIPNIIGDLECDDVCYQLTRVLTEDQDLVPAVLNCLTYLHISDKSFETLQKKTLHMLKTFSKTLYFSNFVQFLLGRVGLNESSYNEAALGLRDNLYWTYKNLHDQTQEMASSQVISISAIKTSMVTSKTIANAWFRVLSECKSETDCKSIDIILYLLLFSLSNEWQKQTETLLSKQIKTNVIKKKVFNDVFDSYKPALLDSLKPLIGITNSLMRSKAEPTVEEMAVHIYTLMFRKFRECTQTLVAELLHLGFCYKQCVSNMLLIFNNVATEDLALLKTHSVRILSLVDKIDDMSISEITDAMNLVCGLAYNTEDSVISDDIHVIIRKDLISSNPRNKIKGVLTGVYAVKHLIKNNNVQDCVPDFADDMDVSYDNLLTGKLKEAANIINLILNSTKCTPDIASFFYDEMSKIIESESNMHNTFLHWLKHILTNDLLEHYTVSSVNSNKVNGLQFSMQFCLNSDDEVEETMAVNIAGITLQPRDHFDVGMLSPLFRLTQTLYTKQSSVKNINAYLGSPVIMPAFDDDLIPEMEHEMVSNILDCQIHCLNWFRELVNAFASCDGLKSKLVARIHHIVQLEKSIEDIVMKTQIVYKIPFFIYDARKYIREEGFKRNKPAFLNAKNNKKVINNETVSAITLRTQSSQKKTITKKISIINNIPLRTLNSNILNLICIKLSFDSSVSNCLNIASLKFLLKCASNNLESILISTIRKKNIIAKNQDLIKYDPEIAESLATQFKEVLPFVLNHLNDITTYIDICCGETDGFYELLSDNLSSDIVDSFDSLELIFTILEIFFRWIGFKDGHQTLLNNSLNLLVSATNKKVPLKTNAFAVIESFKKYKKYCIQSSLAVTLLSFLNSIIPFADASGLDTVRLIAYDFLNKQWKLLDGFLEKGTLYNKNINTVTMAYFYNTDLTNLKDIAEQVVDDTKTLKTSTDRISVFKSFTKSNFPILYKNIGLTLYESAKGKLSKPLKSTESISLWIDIVELLKMMSEIALTLDSRNNLLTYFKISYPIIKLFVSKAIPILEKEFRGNTERVLNIISMLQLSTKFLQSLCCHSRLKKDMALMSKVPQMRHLLETLVFKVKEMLSANNCSEAFWMGNLKNKDIHGEYIPSEENLDRDSTEDCDEQLPDDLESIDSDNDEVNLDSKSSSELM